MKWIYVLAVIVLISAISPFIASSNPDGLEKTAEIIGTEGKSLPALMPDYTIVFLEGKISEVTAMVIGALIVFGLSYTIVKFRS